MPKFSRISLQRLGTADEKLQNVFQTVIKLFDCSILEGFRPNDRQEMLFKEGKSQKRGGQSKHNVYPSLAVDAAPYYIKKPHIRWINKSAFLGSLGRAEKWAVLAAISTLLRWYFFAGMVLGVAALKGVKLRWGGDWDKDTFFNDQIFDDLCHFEIVEE